MAEQKSLDFDANTQTCTRCGASVMMEYSKTGNKPYLVNSDKSYHRTFGAKWGEEICCNNKAELEQIKASVEAAKAAGGAKPADAPSASRPAPPKPETTPAKPIDLTLFKPGKVTALQLAAASECEIFWNMLYPFAYHLAEKTGAVDLKDTRIAAAGIMHDFATIYAAKIKQSVESKETSPHPEGIDLSEKME